MKIKKFNEHLNSIDKVITTTFQVVTEESAEFGDYADQGWDDEEGQSMIPDEYDIEEGITVVDKAVKFLEYEKYTTEPSSSNFQKGVSYISTDPVTDYTDGTDTFYSCHLNGFTEEEEFLIYLKITDKKSYDDWKESGLTYEEYKNSKKYNL